MYRDRFLKITLLSILLMSFLCLAIEAQESAPLKRHTEIPVAVTNDMATSWSGSSLLVLQNRFSETPHFDAFDEQGAEQFSFNFAIPEAKLINIYDHDYALGQDGSMAVAGSAYTSDSRGTTFLAWLSPDKKQQVVVRLTPYFPLAVTLAADGTIWVAGSIPSEGPGKPADRNQPLLRHYDKTGKLLGSYLAWSSLNPRPHTIPPTVASVLVSSKSNTVGFYSPLSGTYTELNSSGRVIKQVGTPPEIDAHVLTNAAICSDDSVYLGASHNKGPVGRAFWGIYRLNRETGRWDYSQRTEAWSTLLGCNGTKLATTSDSRSVSWVDFD